MKADIRSFSMEELAAYLSDYRLPAFRTKEIFSWLHKKQVKSFGEMTSLPQKLRERLAEEADLVTLTPVQVRVSAVDGTRKYLFALPDGNIIESVLMRYHYGCTVCISTQVGCRMGCRFCASTLGGLVRNLLASEMLEQVYRVQEDVGERISHVVLMGAGEPMDNLDAVLRFVRLITSPDGQQLGQRNITLSTCGIVPGIDNLADQGSQMTLALSLHAASDEMRKKLMPVANRYPLFEVLSACRRYYEKTGRRVTFEYSLVAGENDGIEEAKKLALLLSGFPGHVNLIPVNPIKERAYRPTDRRHVEEFQKYLEKSGIQVTVRREMGRDIEGACGQLRKSYLDNAF